MKCNGMNAIRDRTKWKDLVQTSSSALAWWEKEEAIMGFIPF